MRPTFIGAKIRLSKHEAKNAQIGLLVDGGNSGLPFFNSNAEFNAKLSVRHVVGERITLAYNIGGNWETQFDELSSVYPLVLGITLIDQLQFYSEVYGVFGNLAKRRNQYNFGLIYLIRENLQIDLFGGGTSESKQNLILGFGASMRFPRK